MLPQFQQPVGLAVSAQEPKYICKGKEYTFQQPVGLAVSAQRPSESQAQSHYTEAFCGTSSIFSIFRLWLSYKSN